MDEIYDAKGIRPEKLNHIFLGDVNRNRTPVYVSGYHCCDREHGDEEVRITSVALVGRNPITVNRDQRLFEAEVEDKTTGTPKSGGSTFFNPAWSRQDVVDCISRVDTLTPREIECHNLTGHRKLPVLRIDRTTGLVVVDIVDKTTYPILR